MRRHAERAIAERLRGTGQSIDRCIISVQRDPDRAGAVILHVNSGASGCASESRLARWGYRTEWIRFDGYGCKLRVMSAVTASAPEAGA